jgi:hypothetical protein
LETKGTVSPAVAGGFREDHDAAAERLQQLEMSLHGGDLVLGGTLEQAGAVPAGDEGEIVAVEDFLQDLRLTRELAAELDSGVAGGASLGETGLEGDVVAQPAHVIVGPTDRVDAEADHRSASP